MSKKKKREREYLFFHILKPKQSRVKEPDITIYKGQAMSVADRITGTEHVYE